MMPELDFSKLPNRGSILNEVVDLDELAGSCQRCGTEIRYEHHCEHPMGLSAIVGHTSAAMKPVIPTSARSRSHAQQLRCRNSRQCDGVRQNQSERQNRVGQMGFMQR
jgi:hypothetical protein